jgi:hypothetical protein
MTRSLMQAWYQSPKKRIILDQSSNSPWTPPGVSRFVLFGPSKITEVSFSCPGQQSA